MPINKDVDAIVINSLYATEEVPDRAVPPDAVVVECLTRTFCFHPERIAANKDRIEAILQKMAPDFFAQSPGGGGSSFLNLCVTRSGEQWGEHRDVEALCAIAIGAKLARWSFGKTMWAALPGGMPYITFDIEMKEPEDTQPQRPPMMRSIASAIAVLIGCGTILGALGGVAMIGMDRDIAARREVISARCAHAGESPDAAMVAYCSGVEG